MKYIHIVFNYNLFQNEMKQTRCNGLRRDDIITPARKYDYYYK